MDPERQVRYLASDERNIVNGSSKNMYKVNEYEKYVQEKIQIAPKILGTVERRLVRDRYDPDTTGLGKTSRRRGDRTILFDWRPEDDTSYSYSEISHDRSTVKLNDMFVKTNHVEIGGRRSGAIHDSKYESKHRGRFDVRNYVDRDDSLGEFQNEKNKGKRLDDEETKKSRQVEVITVDAYGNESVVVVKKKNSDEFGAQGSLDAPKERLPVWELKCLEEMTDRDWRIMREDLNIAVTGLKCAHHPLRHWSDYLSQISKSKSSSLKSSTLSVDNRTKIPQSILHVIKDLGYKNPTPIQRQAIPIIYDGYDVIGIAETGSGKTAAFIIPMLMRMLNQPSHTESNYSHKLESQFGGTMKNVRPQKKRDNEESNRGPYGIVLAPTRELAQQIEHEANRFCRPLGLESIAIVGGHSIGQQEIKMMMRTLERGGVDLIVATPGRLRDCIEQHVITLSSCKMVILDEADRMIHLNYEEDLRFILASTPKSDNLLTQNTGISDTNVSNNLNNTDTEDVQMIMFSATMPSGLQGLAKSFLTKPLTIMIGDTGISALSVEQRVEIINSPAEKDKRLIQLLSSGIYSPPIVVFVNLKTTVDYVTKKLEAAGLRCVGLHGGKSQEQRETSVAQVRSSSRDILVATDVAGRGLDIKDVSLVVNYNMSPTIEEYVHRVGRTGRMGKTGTAITFLSTESDGPLFYDLATMLRRLPADKRLANDLLEHEFASSRLAHTFVANVTGKNKKGSGSRIKGEEKIFAYGL